MTRATSARKASEVSELRAIAHPVRLRMLSLLTGTSLCAADLAREIGITHANASYHLRQLAAAGQVVEAGEQRVRGGLAKLYTYPHEAEHERRAGPDATDEDRLLYAQALWVELERRLALRVGEERRAAGYSADLDGWVSGHAWEKAMKLVREASALLHDENRLPHAPDTIHVSFTSWLFRMREAE